jgi:hypothetical protein
VNPVRPLTTWLVVVGFATGMAWVEAASVFYLRALVDRIEPYQVNPLPISEAFGPVELVREAATLMMLLMVGMLAARPWRPRLAYTMIAFGVWDVLYYVFLRMMSDWPRTLFDWDILFLLPLPWWGPVLAPVSIALLMIVWGTLTTQFPDRTPVTPVTAAMWALTAVGIVLALYVFMADSVHVVHRGLDATRQVLPTQFNWPLFCVALTLMALPVVQIGWPVRSSRG